MELKSSADRSAQRPNHWPLPPWHAGKGVDSYGTCLPAADTMANLVRTAMTCQECGCRMVARSSLLPASLVCVDCGYPADARLQRDLSRRSWHASLALLAFVVLTGLVLSFSVMLDLRQGTPALESSSSERVE